MHQLFSINLCCRCGLVLCTPFSHVRGVPSVACYYRECATNQPPLPPCEIFVFLLTCQEPLRQLASAHCSPGPYGSLIVPCKRSTQPLESGWQFVTSLFCGPIIGLGSDQIVSSRVKVQQNVSHVNTTASNSSSVCSYCCQVVLELLEHRPEVFSLAVRPIHVPWSWHLLKLLRVLIKRKARGTVTTVQCEIQQQLLRYFHFAIY